MAMKKPSCILFASAALVLFSGPPSLACNECHSKDPKMVRMHQALEFKDCFLCHGPASKRIGDKMTPNAADPLCTRCHVARGAGTTVPAPAPKP